MNTKNIWKNGKYYVIRKSFDGKEYFFGTYRTLEDAIKVRDVLEEVNYGFPQNAMRNISKVENRGYRVRKMRNHKTIWDCVYPTLEIAMYERDLLESADWDIDALCESIDETGADGIKFLDGVKKLSSTFQTHPRGRNDYFATSRGKH